MKFNDWLRHKVQDWIEGVKIVEKYPCKTLIHVRFFGEEEDYQIIDLSKYKKDGIAVLENHYSLQYSDDIDISYTFIKDAMLYKALIKNIEIWSYREL